MELESLFEEIYALSNHTTEYGTNYLERPLDTVTKPPMYLNESKLFEEVYFEYRLKPLFEQVLRETVSIDHDKIIITESNEDRQKNDIELKKHFYEYVKNKIDRKE